MIWGCCIKVGIVILTCIASRTNSHKYTDILKSHLLPFIHEKKICIMDFSTR